MRGKEQCWFGIDLNSISFNSNESDFKLSVALADTMVANDMYR